MRSSLLIATSMLVVACGSDRGEPAETARAPNGQPVSTGAEREALPPGAMAENCPVHVQGTTVQTESIDGGAAWVFVTSGDVTALRERVRNMAAMHESHGMRDPQEQETTAAVPLAADDPAAGAKIGDPDDGVSAGGMPQSMMPVDVDTRVEDVEGGARLVMVATDASDVDALRMHAQRHAQRMSAGQCAMSPHSMQGGTIVQ